MGILKLRGLGEVTVKSSPTFWEYPPPMGFIYGMAPNKNLLVNQTYIDHKAEEWRYEWRDLMPTPQ